MGRRSIKPITTALRACAVVLAACTPAPTPAAGPLDNYPAAGHAAATATQPAPEPSSTLAPKTGSQLDEPTSTPSHTAVATDCLQAAEVTLDDVGRARCVTGTVRRAYADQTAAYVDLSADFYLLSYDLDLSAIAAGTCLVLTDEINQLGSKPVIVVAYARPPAACGESQAIQLPGRTGSTSGGVTEDTPTEPPSPTPVVIVSPTPTHTPVPPPPPQPPTPNCDPAYPTVCIPPPPPDLDCGDIPYRRFTVLWPDPHRFDGDNDGIGCESG